MTNIDCMTIKDHFLRDFFAAMAIKGILQNPETPDGWSYKGMSEAAYKIADAMLEAR